MFELILSSVALTGLKSNLEKSSLRSSLKSYVYIHFLVHIVKKVYLLLKKKQKKNMLDSQKIYVFVNYFVIQRLHPKAFFKFY